VLKVQNLTKKYGSIISVDNLSFEIAKGEVVGLLGSNGAGKTTTMNMITGYIPPTSGEISLLNQKISSDIISVKRSIGYLPEIPPLYLDMTVEEQLEFVCSVKSIKKNGRRAEIERVCALANVSDVCKRRIKNLSKGYRQRVGVAQTLIGSPELLILDEPTVGLDPQQIIDMRELIKSLQKEHTIIISSHILSEIASICTRLLILKKGKLVANDTPQNLTNNYARKNMLDICVKGERKTVECALRKISEIENIVSAMSNEEGCVSFILTVKKSVDIRQAVFEAMSRIAAPILMMKTQAPSLEDVFIKLSRD